MSWLRKCHWNWQSIWNRVAKREQVYILCWQIAKIQNFLQGIIGAWSCQIHSKGLLLLRNSKAVKLKHVPGNSQFSNLLARQTCHLFVLLTDNWTLGKRMWFSAAFPFLITKHENNYIKTISKFTEKRKRINILQSLSGLI